VNLFEILKETDLSDVITFYDILTPDQFTVALRDTNESTSNLIEVAAREMGALKSLGTGSSELGGRTDVTWRELPQLIGCKSDIVVGPGVGSIFLRSPAEQLLCQVNIVSSPMAAKTISERSYAMARQFCDSGLASGRVEEGPDELRVPWVTLLYLNAYYEQPKDEMVRLCEGVIVLAICVYVRTVELLTDFDKGATNLPKET
jgi:hypothetical protein